MSLFNRLRHHHNSRKGQQLVWVEEKRNVIWKAIGVSLLLLFTMIGKVLVFHSFDVILICLNMLFYHLHSLPPPSDSCCFEKDIPF